MSLFIPPTVRATNANNAAMSGAKWYFYVTETTTPATVYTTSALSTPHGSSVTADAGGKFASIYLDPDVTYRAILAAAGADPLTTSIADIDPYDVGDTLRSELADSGGSALVTFIQAGSGAVERTVQAKLRDRVDAFDFIPVAKHAGIIAGSNTDDLSSYLQDALDTGKLVRLPDVGLMWIASPLEVPAGGGIVGGGKASIIKAKADFGNVPLIRNATQLPASLAARDSGLVFRDFMVDGNKANNSTATEFSHGICLFAVDGAVIDNVWAKDPKGDGLLLMYAFESPTADYDIGCANIHGSIRTENCARQGVALVCAEGCVLDVFDTETSLFSLDLETDNAANYIRNNFIRLVSIGSGTAGTESSGGFGVAGASGDVRDNRIEFYIRDSEGVGGTWRNAVGLSLRGTVDTCDITGLVGIDAGTSASTVDLDVTIRDAAAGGMTAAETAGSIYNGRVTVDGAAATGVSISDAAGGTLRLRVENVSAGPGIQLVDTTNMTFPDCYSGDNSSHNVWLTGACSGNRFPNLRTGASTFGAAFVEADTSNNNRATDARLTLGGGGTATLVGAASLIEAEPLRGSASWNPASIADGDAESTTFTVTGAALGDFVEVSLSVSLKGCVLIGEVSAANTVKATIANNTGSAQDIDSGTVRALVKRTYSA